MTVHTLVQDWLTSDKMAAWIKENNLIKIVLRDSLHQPQYVEKLEKILRFVIKAGHPTHIMVFIDNSLHQNGLGPPEESGALTIRSVRAP